MKTVRIVLALGVLAACALAVLWSMGWIESDVADESFRRLILVIGAVGFALSLVFFLFSVRQKKESVSGEVASRKPNSGPQF